MIKKIRFYAKFPYLDLGICVVSVIQFWANGSWDSLFPISMRQTANLWVKNTIFYDKYAILLHPGTRWIKNFASRDKIMRKDAGCAGNKIIESSILSEPSHKA